jgi:alkyl hydroperoxide reductase subunit AhpF
MALLSPADQDKLRETFADMTSPVKIVFFTQTLGCDTCPQTRQIIDELPVLTDKVTIEEANLVLDTDKAKQFGVDRAPTLAIVGVDGQGVERDSRIRFVGAPAGYAFISLVQAVLLVGGREGTLSPENREKVAAVSEPLTIQVYTTPT